MTTARRHVTRWRYAPLVQYLAALPADQARVRLTFTEIETMIRKRLAMSARQPGYWSYDLNRHWAPLGFTARLDRLSGGGVTFMRTQGQ